MYERECAQRLRKIRCLHAELIFCPIFMQLTDTVKPTSKPPKKPLNWSRCQTLRPHQLPSVDHTLMSLQTVRHTAWTTSLTRTVSSHRPHICQLLHLPKLLFGSILAIKWKESKTKTNTVFFSTLFHYFPSSNNSEDDINKSSMFITAADFTPVIVSKPLHLYISLPTSNILFNNFFCFVSFGRIQRCHNSP